MYKGEDVILGIVSKHKSINFSQLCKQASMNEDSVRRVVESLKAGGYVTVETRELVRGIQTDELSRYVRSEFPEISVYKKALQNAPISSLTPEEKSIGIRWAKVKGLVAIENGKLVAAKEKAGVDAISESLRVAINQIAASGVSDDKVVMEELFERRLIDKKIIKEITIARTSKKYDEGGGFDFNVPAKDAPLGKNHPITKMTKKIKGIMAELGFQEMDGSIIESSFWNFDALFQPQDHPARELADTFYLERPSPLPDEPSLVERVKKAHEDGWKYKWDQKEASKTVLRTHTTCLSARYLSQIKDKKPRKYFAIGRVFRNEATDYKHLAEFHQVEGIIAWDGATFTDLLGVLKEFYRKLGFEKIRFRPSFFPYTEPSLEIEVYFEKRKQWLELGGAGIFRPEVSKPLAGVYPVLAWGLSLERPLMLLLELEDIRDFYKNDIDFLSSKRLDI